MDHRKQRFFDGFDRFQRLLFAMRAGDTVSASEASHVCGLSEDVCRTVFEGLVRVGLMTHEGGDRFVRKRPDLQPAQPIESDESGESGS